MPSVLLLTGAPLHVAASPMRKVCCGVEWILTKSTHSISFFLQIHIRADWEKKAWFHSSLTSPSGRVHTQRCLSNVTDAGNSTVRTPISRWIWIVLHAYVPTTRSHWSCLSDRKCSQVAQQMRRSIGPSGTYQTFPMISHGQEVGRVSNLPSF